MKYLIRKINLKLVGVCLALVLVSSCAKLHDADEDLQQEDVYEGGFMLPTMMNSIISTSPGALQTQQNLQADSYANYLEAPSVFLGNVNTMTYVTKVVWVGSWTVSTNGVMNNWLYMKKIGHDKKYPDLYAIALIIKVAAGHRLVDTFGPYPYSQYGLTAEPKWDSPKEAYAAFFSDLDIAISSLRAAKEADPKSDEVYFKKWDRSTLGGDYNNWIRLANTLKLRLAIRISNVDPAKAKTEAENAVDPAHGGVLEGTNFSVANPNGNPYYQLSNAWSDTRVSAAVITYLQGFGDPRLESYALPATDPLLNGEYRGIRPGVEKPTKTVYENYSKYNIGEMDPVKQVDGAESFFLRAEGALRGWNMGGNAQTFYEEGIRVSIAKNGVAGADEYLQSTSTQLPYVDPNRPDYNSSALTDVTVKWNEGLGFEKKLEKIITQKWITMFPEGTEAWSEFRRTGYPKLYHIMASKNPLLPTGTYIKRLTYPAVITTSSVYKVAIDAYLGGRDNEDVIFYWMEK